MVDLSKGLANYVNARNAGVAPNDAMSISTFGNLGAGVYTPMPANPNMTYWDNDLLNGGNGQGGVQDGHLRGQGQRITAPLPAKPRPRGAPETPPPAASAPATSPQTSDNDKPLDTHYYQSLLDRLDPNEMQSFQNQDATMAELDDLYKKLQGREPEMDFSPLLAYHDAHYGDNLSKGYQRPLSQDELDNAKAVLQEHILQGEKGLTDSEAGILEAALHSEATRLGWDENAQLRERLKKLDQDIQGGHDATKVKTTDMTVQGQKAVGAGHDAAKVAATGAGGDKLLSDYQKRVASRNKDVDETLGKLDQAEENLELAHQPGGNATAAGLLPVQLATTIAKRFNEREIKAAGGKDAASLENSLVAAYEQAAHGQISDTNYRFIKQFINTARQAKQRMRQEALDEISGQYLQQPKNKGKTMDDARRELGGEAFSHSSEAPSAAPSKVTSAKDLP